MAKKRSLYLRQVKLGALLERAGWSPKKAVFDGQERDVRGLGIAEIFGDSASFLVIQLVNERGETCWIEVGRWGGDSEVVEISDWSINLSSVFRFG